MPSSTAVSPHSNQRSLDLAYLELASIRGLALATVDDRLREACVRVGVEVVA